MKGRTIVLLGLGVILLLALFAMARPQSMSLQQRVQKDLATERARFLPQNSIDISQAMKLITFDEPNLLNPPTAQPPLLLYPPSAETLERLSGV
jgi:hypothetical protein